MKKEKEIDWDNQPLGKQSDKSLSKKLGVSRTTVAYHRNKKNISPFVPAPSKIGVNWSQQPLGKLPDRDLAIHLGVMVSTVKRARKSRGIPSFGEVERVIQMAEDTGTNIVHEAFPPSIKMTKEFEVTIHIRNNCLKQRRLELGHETARGFAEAAGVRYGSYVALETMKEQPTRSDGDWREIALKTAAFHGCSPEDLFPPAVRKARQRELIFRVGSEDLPSLLETYEEPVVLPDKNLIDIELKLELEGIISTLTPREEQIIRMLYGLNDKGMEYGQQEVADHFDVSQTRVGQIKAEALRKIRHPSRSRKLRDFVRY